MTCACHVKVFATERAFSAMCSCGWRTARADRDQRDADVEQHLHRNREGDPMTTPQPIDADAVRDAVAYIEAVLRQDLDAKAAVLAGCDPGAVIHTLGCMLGAVAWASGVDLIELCADWRRSVAAIEAEQL